MLWYAIHSALSCVRQSRVSKVIETFIHYRYGIDNAIAAPSAGATNIAILQCLSLT